jgi:hypothetical protein
VVDAFVVLLLLLEVALLVEAFLLGLLLHDVVELLPVEVLEHEVVPVAALLLALVRVAGLCAPS